MMMGRRREASRSSNTAFSHGGAKNYSCFMILIVTLPSTLTIAQNQTPGVWLEL